MEFHPTRLVHALSLGCALALSVPVNAGPARATSDPCIGSSGSAYGRCSAYCVHMDCDETSAARGVTPPPYGFTQLTEFGLGIGTEEPSISADGRRIAFRTSGQIVVWDADSDALTQLTQKWSGALSNLMIHPDGTRVIFRGDWDFFSGTGRNKSADLWEVEIATGQFRRLTQIAAGGVRDPSLSGDGEWLTFQHNNDLTGQNPDHSDEIFRLNRVSLEVEQITVTEGTANREPDINHDGTLITFASAHDFDGTNPEGTHEIWLWQASTGSIRNVTHNATSTSDQPRISDDGRYIAFRGVDLSLEEGPGGRLFLADLLDGSLRRITTSKVSSHEMAPDGSRVFFVMDSLTGDDLSTIAQLWVYDILTDSLEQVTRVRPPSGCASSLSGHPLRCVDVARDTNWIAYRSHQPLDPNVVNPATTHQLFLGRPAVGIDIEPGSSRNLLGLRGAVTVALLSSSTLDVTTEIIQDHTLTFGATGGEPSWIGCRPDPVDVNADGLPDLICEFNLAAAGFKRGHKEGFVRAVTRESYQVQAVDVVRVVGRTGRVR